MRCQRIKITSQTLFQNIVLYCKSCAVLDNYTYVCPDNVIKSLRLVVEHLIKNDNYGENDSNSDWTELINTIILNVPPPF
jgi:hypothetical protein